MEIVLVGLLKLEQHFGKESTNLTQNCTGHEVESDKGEGGPVDKDRLKQGVEVEDEGRLMEYHPFIR